MRFKSAWQHNNRENLKRTELCFERVWQSVNIKSPQATAGRISLCDWGHIVFEQVFLWISLVHVHTCKRAHRHRHRHRQTHTHTHTHTYTHTHTHTHRDCDYNKENWLETSWSSDIIFLTHFHHFPPPSPPTPPHLHHRLSSLYQPFFINRCKRLITVVRKLKETTVFRNYIILKKNQLLTAMHVTFVYFIFFFSLLNNPARYYAPFWDTNIDFSVKFPASVL
jgi:hypothetical protein